MNRLQILGILRNLFQLAPPNGFLAKPGSNVVARTFQNTPTATWTNADSTIGNPQVDFNIAGISPVTVPNGGTGDTSLTPYALLTANTTATGNVVQPGLGTTGQVFTSNGPASFGSFQNLPVIPPQTVFQATAVMTAAQFRNLKTVPVQIVAPPGAGKVIVPITAYGKVQISTTAFGSGSAVFLYWGSAGTQETNIRFDSGTFDSSNSGYYLPTFVTPSTSVIDSANIEGQGLFISVNSSDFSGGGTSTTATITVFYSVIQI